MTSHPRRIPQLELTFSDRFVEVPESTRRRSARIWCNGGHGLSTTHADVLGLKIALLRFGGESRMGREERELSAVIVGGSQVVRHALLKKCAALSAILMLLSSGLVCMCCAVAPSQICCRLQLADGSKTIEPSISVKSDADGCSRETENCASRKRCCLRETQSKSTATLPQMADNRETASNSGSPPSAFWSERRQECPPDAPVMNRGSTYLEFCVLRI